MRLRTILMILSLLALASTTIGGFYYYYSLRETAYTVAQRSAAARTEMIRTQISSFLAENLKTVRTLAVMEDIRRAVTRPDLENLASANQILDRFQQSLKVDVCYLMNHKGLTIASSNRRDEDTFVGESYAIRPYFKLAIMGSPAKYLALGMTSHKRGAYYSHPVYGMGGYPVDYPGKGKPLGVVVIKAPIESMENNIIRPAQGMTILAGPYGLIFSSSKPQWLFKTLFKLDPEEIDDIAQSRQFGPGPWTWAGLAFKGGDMVVDRKGDEYLYYSMGIDNYMGWEVIHLQSLSEISRGVFDPLVKTTGSLVLVLCILAGLGAYYLYRKASMEIGRRRRAEKELRRNEERFRELYHNTPAMLQSIDSQGRLVRVSDYWSMALGYSADEAFGKKLSDFLTKESRTRFKGEILPRLFAKGFCTDVSLQFAKHNGEVIDALFSAAAERGMTGGVNKCLAVLVDISQLEQTKKELTSAKEKLSNYSKDLERQVKERTWEITGFLEYTPAVVYMKDTDGKYILVNSRHEELFGVPRDNIKGKTVYDVFPTEIADVFRGNDLKVLHSKRHLQIEELLPHPDGLHHYLTVRFPVLDEKGNVLRLCGISIDITDIKKAQDQLRRLSGSIMASQEKERTAIARELHDELGQVLTALRMDAVWLAGRLADDPKSAERAETMRDLIDSTISEVKSIATRLRPAVLDDLGLMDALEWHANEFEKRTGISCVFKQQGVSEVPEFTAIAVYRVAQEALTNVARHAQAAHVEVTLAEEGGWLRLSVWDDGKGFTPQTGHEQEDLGVAGMHERAVLAGGRLEIASQPGKGTVVRLAVPIKRLDGAEA